MSPNNSNLQSVIIRRMILSAVFAGLFTMGPLASSLAQHSGGGGKGAGGHSAVGGSHSSGGHETGADEEEHGGRKGRSSPGGAYSGGGTRNGHGAGIEDKVLRPGQAAAPGAAGRGGGRPSWAGGTIPENLALGRLNVARAPRQVLQRALDEAYATNLDKNADGILDADADFTTIESPRANLALYREALSGQRKVAGAWTLDQAATFLGKAADKNIAVSTDTVRALDLILEVSPNYATFSYDRAASHPADMATVFSGTGYSGNGIDAFAQAADDERAITLYTHNSR